MLLKITDQSGHTEVDTEIDSDTLVQNFFTAAKRRGMWGLGITHDKKKDFITITSDTTIDKLLPYKEVIMLPRQTGG